MGGICKKEATPAEGSTHDDGRRKAQRKRLWFVTQRSTQMRGAMASHRRLSSMFFRSAGGQALMMVFAVLARVP